MPHDPNVPSRKADVWRLHAADARRAAESMTEPLAKQQLCIIATAYERLADHAERSQDQGTVSTEDPKPMKTNR